MNSIMPRASARASLLAAASLSALLFAAPVSAQSTPPSAAAQPPAADAPDSADIIVTGYRASLESSTNAKRNATGFSDTIFAEDTGKFPDTNIAESLNRVPGVTIARDITGEGLQITIRGLVMMKKTKPMMAAMERVPVFVNPASIRAPESRQGVAAAIHAASLDRQGDPAI
eukprot:gene40845-55204_t